MSTVFYVLTSSGCDCYSALTRISLASIRLTNPGIRVAVVCDPETDRAMRVVGDRLCDEADRWMVFETPEGSPVFRNRFLKTNLRNLVDGPFLFMDSDTVVRGNMSALFDLNTDIAAAPNHSAVCLEDQVCERDGKTLERMGWSVRSDVFFNGGVIYYNDTKAARDFASDWHLKWGDALAAGCGCYDQPSLNAACLSGAARIETLEALYNAQIGENPYAAPDALIWHYYATGELIPMLIFENHIAAARGNFILDGNELGNLLGRSHPFKPAFWDSACGWKFILRAAAILTAALGQSDDALHSEALRLRKLDRHVAALAENAAFDILRLDGRKRCSRKLLPYLLRDRPGSLLRRMSRIPFKVLGRLTNP